MAGVVVPVGAERKGRGVNGAADSLVCVCVCNNVAVVMWGTGRLFVPHPHLALLCGVSLLVVSVVVWLVR